MPKYFNKLKQFFLQLYIRLKNSNILVYNIVVCSLLAFCFILESCYFIAKSGTDPSIYKPNILETPPRILIIPYSSSIGKINTNKHNNDETSNISDVNQNLIWSLWFSDMISLNNPNYPLWNIFHLSINEPSIAKCVITNENNCFKNQSNMFILLVSFNGFSKNNETKLKISAARFSTDNNKYDVQNEYELLIPKDQNIDNDILEKIYNIPFLSPILKKTQQDNTFFIPKQNFICQTPALSEEENKALLNYFNYFIELNDNEYKANFDMVSDITFGIHPIFNHYKNLFELTQYPKEKNDQSINYYRNINNSNNCYYKENKTLQALFYLKNNDIETAKSLLYQSAKESPLDDYILSQYAESLIIGGYKKEATQVLQRIIQLIPESFRYRKRLSYIFMEDSNFSGSNFSNAKSILQNGLDYSTNLDRIKNFRTELLRLCNKEDNWQCVTIQSSWLIDFYMKNSGKAINTSIESNIQDNELFKEALCLKAKVLIKNSELKHSLEILESIPKISSKYTQNKETLQTKNNIFSYTNIESLLFYQNKLPTKNDIAVNICYESVYKELLFLYKKSGEHTKAIETWYKIEGIVSSEVFISEGINLALFMQDRNYSLEVITILGYLQKNIYNFSPKNKALWHEILGNWHFAQENRQDATLQWKEAIILYEQIQEYNSASRLKNLIMLNQ